MTIMLISDRAKKRKVFTRQDVKLYREAAQIFDRLINLSSLSAGLPEDILSEKTRDQISIWLNQYRRELDK